MVFSGNDPTGGAGIQADIEALGSHGCRAAPVITALTVQDTGNVIAVEPVPADLLVEQARAVLDDMPVAAFKIGLIGAAETAEALHGLLIRHPGIPVVLDPVLAAGGGAPLASEALIDTIVDRLLPLTTVLTPNTREAHRLARGADTTDACAMALLERGSEYVLITGADESTERVFNRFYGDRRLLERFAWERIPGTYHGSGCTLAASIAGLLARGRPPRIAVREAQQYTWEALRHGYQTGRGQKMPDRLYWMRDA
jgi:hydroxymethylpyrimidine/phosphomethylpyrimidine kinase